MKKAIWLLFAAVAMWAHNFQVSSVEQFRQALQNAATNGEADTIHLARGVYKTTEDGKGTFVYFSNEEFNLTLIGGDGVILSGDRHDRILKHQSTKQSGMRLVRLTFVDGNATDGKGGGGVWHDGDMEVVECNFTNNSAKDGGGGFYTKDDAIIRNSTFTNNSAEGGGGGFSAGNTTVENSTFTNNSAEFGGGFSSPGTIIVRNSTFTNNNANYGSGFSTIYQILSSSSGSTSSIGIGGYLTIIQNSTFTNNFAGHDGGGFYSNSVQIQNSTFTNNSAKGKGGGFSAGNTTVENSTFTNNSAEGNGGGFYSHYGGARVENSIFTNNSARNNGGGFFSYYNDIEIQNSTFTNNSANHGGGFYSYENATVQNSVFTHNKKLAFSSGSLKATNILVASNEGGIRIYGGRNNQIYNSIFLDNASFDINASDRVIIENLDNNYLDLSKVHAQSFHKNNIFQGVDPRFVDRANGDFHLLPGSDLIDAGTTDLDFLPQKDMDGNLRVVGTSVDIGPYEYSSTKPTILSITYQGEPREGEELVFDVEYRLADGRSLGSIAFDFEGSGRFEERNSHTYMRAGDYTLTAKVTDSKGEYTIKSITLHIQRATLAQKLASYLSPEQIEKILPIIEADKEEAMESGQCLPIKTPHTDMEALLERLAGKPLGLSGYYIHYGRGSFEWLYVPKSLHWAAKLEPGIKKGYGLVWSRFPRDTKIEKEGDTFIFSR